MFEYRVVIPARYAASRLPGKPLRSLAGKPMIQWVYERASAAAAQEVVVATDDERIAAVARGFGAAVVMTAASHQSGTDRIAEVARIRDWSDEQIIVNLQGDEPLMPAALIDQVAQLLLKYPDADMATLATPLSVLGEMPQRPLDLLHDPNVVKVVIGHDHRALYFSRAPIPWDRDGVESATGQQTSFREARRHLGIYAYRVGALRRLAALAPTRLEQLEKLEQLRALENGFDIRVAECSEPPGPDVNTADDVARVEALLVKQRP